MLQKVRSPFAGKPATRQVADHNGAPAFYVQPRVLTPVRAMAASWLTGLGVVAGLGFGLNSVASTPNADSGMLTAAIVVPLVGGFVLASASLRRVRDPLRRRRMVDVVAPNVALGVAIGQLGPGQSRAIDSHAVAILAA